MRLQPAGSRSMAAFTTHTLCFEINLALRLVDLRRQSMAGQAFRRSGWIADSKDLPHALRNLFFQGLIPLCMMVLNDPCAIFGLHGTFAQMISNVTVTRGSAAGSRPHVLTNHQGGRIGFGLCKGLPTGKTVPADNGEGAVKDSLQPGARWSHEFSSEDWWKCILYSVQPLNATPECA